MLGFLFKSHRRRQLLAQPLQSQWLQFIERNVGVYRLLPPDQRQRLVDAARIIVAERPFVGCDRLTITDEIKITIAAQAALLLLGEEGYYFDRVPTIFVYPRFQTIRSVRAMADARLVEEGVAVEGQVLEQGEVRLAWEEVLFGSRDPAD